MTWEKRLVAEPRRSNRSRLHSHRAEFGLRKAVLTRRRPNIETHSIDFDIIPPSQSIEVGFRATYASNDAMVPRGVVGRRTWVLGLTVGMLFWSLVAVKPAGKCNCKPCAWHAGISISFHAARPLRATSPNGHSSSGMAMARDGAS
jgi:hypothetical protein